ncbi:MAG: BrxA family protein [Planctomycetaceae bacterium]
MKYKADITAGALKLPESRLIADLLLRQVDAEGWKDAIVTKNVLQARNPATARRLTTLIRGRLETMGPELWKLVRDGKGRFAHSLAAAVKHSPLLGDFLEIVVAEQYRLFSPALSPKLFADYPKAVGSVIPKCRSGTRRHRGGSVHRCIRCLPRRVSSRTHAASNCKQSTLPIRCFVI